MSKDLPRKVKKSARSVTRPRAKSKQASRVEGRSAREIRALVVFDFDGTLADTRECIVTSVRATLTEHGFAAPPPSRITAAIGLSLPRLLAAAVGRRLPQSTVELLATSYRKRFRQSAPRLVRPFPGIRELIVSLRHEGYVLGIATSKSRAGVRRLLDDFWPADMFEIIVADDQVTRKKPDPEMLNVILQKVGARPEHALMIGDTIFDVQMGHAAGVRTCAVTWGNHSVRRLRHANPTYVARDASDMKKLVAAWSGRYLADAMAGRHSEGPTAFRRNLSP